MTTDTKRGMTAADLFRIAWVSDAQVSPDGQTIAFVNTRMDEEQDEYLSTIWLVGTAEGSEPRQFTRGPKRDTSPRWSADGRSLAFVSEREGKKPQVYVIGIDGGEPRRLTDLKPGCGEIAWSPDGSRIAFTSRIVPPEPDEKEKEKSKPARMITSLRYKSNDGGFIYDKRKHIFVVAVDGGEPKQITDGDWDDSAPAWSPDGRSLAFSSSRHAERDYDLVSDVWVVSADGGEPRRVTPGRGPCGAPSWSPDGATLAYIGQEYALDMGRNNQVFVIPAAGGEPRSLTASLDRTCLTLTSGGPAWSADSRSVYFGTEDHGTVPVYRAAVDGSGAPEVAVSADDAWQVHSLAVADDGTIAYTCSSSAYPVEVGAKNAAQGWERQLTFLNKTFISEVKLVTPEKFTYERDGFTLDAWVMKPVGFQEGTRYPTLLNVHGGPATQYGWNFFDEFQVQCGAGYAVVYTNPRGSQGYGEAFTRAVRGDWGGGDYQDVILGLEEALKRYDFLDPDRLGVLGGSYGGFMTSWIVGHDHRFKAACSERAVNNVYTLFGTSDIGSFFSETQAGVTPWDEMTWFVQHSPLTYAKQITTPLLILHAENDLRCPMEQAEQLFTVLKKLRKDVKFIRFPDETHEMSRSGRPRHRRDRFGYLLEWFARYLGGDGNAKDAKEREGRHAEKVAV